MRSSTPNSTALRFAIVFLVAIALSIAAGIGLLAYTFRDPPDERPDVAAALYAAADAAGEGETIDLGAVAAFGWDRVFIFPSYTADDDVAEVIGVPWGTGDVFRLPNEGFHLLVFLEGNAVTGWVVINDYEADSAVYFDEVLQEIPIAREDAVFRWDGLMLLESTAARLDIG